MTGENLYNGSTILLVGLSFLSSALTAGVGAGGGLLLLGGMSTLLPSGAIIPLHGLVQLGSNVGRSLLINKHIVLPFAIPLLVGAGVGAALGSQVVFRLPPEWLELGIGLFIFYAVWAPQRTSVRASSAVGGAVFGALCGFLSLLVGATGPLVSAYLQRRIDSRFQVLATLSICVAGLNVLKLAVFSALGFPWREWILLAALMIASGFIGTRVGLGVLGRLPEALFRRGIKGVLSVLALQLCYRSVTTLEFSWL
jgi:uncharacterized protein